MRRGWFVTLAVVLVAVAVTPALAQQSVARKLVTPVMPPSCEGCIYDRTEVGYPTVVQDGPFEPNAAPLRARSGAVELPGAPNLPVIGSAPTRGHLGSPMDSSFGFISPRGGSAGLAPAEAAHREVRQAIRKLG